MDIKNLGKWAFPLLLFLLTAVNIHVNGKRMLKDIELQKSSTQSMYSDDFAIDRRYPDLFLRNVVKGKEVRVFREIWTYDEYATYGRDEEDGNPFDSRYLIDNDYNRWLSLYASKVTVDRSLPSGKEADRLLSPYKGDFLDIGEANDMLRYSFALNHERVQQASAFWYSWYYNSFSEKETKEKNVDMLPNIYVNLDGADTAKYLVALWSDKQELFLMTDRKYAELIS